MSGSSSPRRWWQMTAPFYAAASGGFLKGERGAKMTTTTNWLGTTMVKALQNMWIFGVESCSQSPNSHSLRGTRRSKTWFRDSLSSNTSFTMFFLRIAASTSQNFVTSGSFRLISRVKIHDASSHGSSAQKGCSIFFVKKFPFDKIQVEIFWVIYRSYTPVDFASGWRKIPNTF